MHRLEVFPGPHRVARLLAPTKRRGPSLGALAPFAAAIQMTLGSVGSRAVPGKCPIRARKNLPGLCPSSKSATSTASQAYFTDLAELSICGPLMSRTSSCRRAAKRSTNSCAASSTEIARASGQNIKRSQLCGQKTVTIERPMFRGIWEPRTGRKSKCVSERAIHREAKGV